MRATQGAPSSALPRVPVVEGLDTCADRWKVTSTRHHPQHALPASSSNTTACSKLEPYNTALYYTSGTHLLLPHWTPAPPLTCIACIRLVALVIWLVLAAKQLAPFWVVDLAAGAQLRVRHVGAVRGAPLLRVGLLIIHLEEGCVCGGWEVGQALPRRALGACNGWQLAAGSWQSWQLAVKHTDKANSLKQGA